MPPTLPVSPLAPSAPLALPPVAGVRLASAALGLRYQDRDDALIMAFAPGTTVAGLLTRSTVPGHPVIWCRRHLPQGQARGLVVTAGNANVCNGPAGDAAVTATAQAAAAALDCPPESVFVAATGVIGEPYPIERLTAALPELSDKLGADAWPAAAETIRTTDTFAKGASATCAIDGAPVTLTGIAKGSGMIHPDMATMLAFVATDARIEAKCLAALLRQANRGAFDSITVDGDASTSDTLLLFASAQAEHALIDDPGDVRLDGFKAALHGLLHELALLVVRDGEGAQKLIRIELRGAANPDSARRLAFAIATSPLVKSGIAGAEANWGRIAMALGKTGEHLRPDRLAISIGGTLVCQNGAPVAGDTEAAVTAHLQGRAVTLSVDVGIGYARAEVWTCDLTHGYIDINGSYRS